MIHVLALPVIVFALVGAGWRILGLFDPRGEVVGGLKWIYSFAIGALLLYFLIFFSGLFIYSRSSSFVIVGLLILMSWGRSKQIVADLGFHFHSISRHGFGANHVIIILLMVLVSALFVQSFAPPNDYDSINYHLALPKYDLELGYISPNWYKGAFSFFPSLAENHVRVGLAIGGAPLAQLFTWVFGLFLMVGIYQLVLEIGGTRMVAAAAVLMFVLIRSVTWEFATCYVELHIAFYGVLAYLSFEKLRAQGGRCWAILFGLSLAGGILVKYHGYVLLLCFVPLLFAEVISGKIKKSSVVLAGVIVLALTLPHYVRNLFYTGNPVFPLLNSHFNPGHPNIFSIDEDLYGRTRTLLNYLRILWDISVLPTHLFDGAMIGAPFLLAFAPLAFIRPSRKCWTLLSIVLVYLAFWHWGMTRQVRFLIPIFPFLAALSATGFFNLWAIVRGHERILVGALSLVLLVNQLVFFGIYAIIRIPPALGFVSPDRYHAETPTMTGSYYGACRFVEDSLKPGERYLSFLDPHSFYCPQSSAIVAPAFPEESKWLLTGRVLPKLSPETLKSELIQRNVAYVILETVREFRSGPKSASKLVMRDYSTGQMSRMGEIIQPILMELQPIYHDHNTAVYRASDLILRL